MSTFKIAIDGPSGAGKSTLAKGVAAKLGIVYVDTGAMYRTIGLYVQSKNVSPDDAEGVVALLPEIRLEIIFKDGTQHILLNGNDVGDSIRNNEISEYASKVSKIPKVREFLLDTQRKIARECDVIMDGRDIGTVILPDAQLKIFLTATGVARAERRYRELRDKGTAITFAEVMCDLVRRDERDRNRDIAPAIPADDAVLMDNSEMSVEETVDAVIALANERR